MDEQRSFWLVYPPHLSRDPVQGPDPVAISLPCMKDKSLHLYFKELRLNERRTHCWLTLDPNNARLRVSYVPKPGDVIRMSQAPRA